MKYDRTGIILYTINYHKCIEFYSEILELDILFKTDLLTCFAFGNAYLMIELADEYKGNMVKSDRISTCLRMNFPNIKQLTKKLTSKGVSIDYQKHKWGIVAKFFDPDGNLCAIRDSETFEKQINDYR